MDEDQGGRELPGAVKLCGGEDAVAGTLLDNREAALLEGGTKVEATALEEVIVEGEEDPGEETLATPEVPKVRG